MDIPHGWHVWQGIAGLWYARKLLSSPPIVLRAESEDELELAIKAWSGWPKPSE